MSKLVRVAKTLEIETVFQNAHIRVRHPRAINPREIRDNGFGEGPSYMDCEFFEVEDADLDEAVSALTLMNPGKEVRVYELIRVSQRPAGELVTKMVSKEGVLPA